MNALEIIIRNTIQAHGPLPFSRYMEMCLFHPTHGYYNTHDPLRDFATAPEISQLFGEMIALWCIDSWMKLGSPKEFILLECGPGRGTLMADILRTAALVPEFLNAANVVLLEKSPLLRLKQQEALAQHKVTWINTLDDVPKQKIVMVCNEFFDAFPVQPFVKTHHGWSERAVDVVDNELAYSVLAPNKEHQHYFDDPLFTGAPIGAIAEINITANDWLKNFAEHLKAQGGTALIIDYGYEGPELANTAQAIHQKRMSPALKHIGESDITVHVDFDQLQKIAKNIGISTSAFMPMRDFLLACGIETRAQRLKAKATSEQQDSIDVGLKRLTASEQMGHLFKVLGLFHQTITPPIGCEP